MTQDAGDRRVFVSGARAALPAYRSDFSQYFNKLDQFAKLATS
jgi:hypothetical protein